VEECPVDAITLPEPGDTIEIDEDKCTYCGVCAQTCPWNAVVISGQKATKRSKELEKFELDSETCIGCNICVEACPGDFITEKPSSLSVELPEICTYCGLCAQMCPVDAIECEVELGPAKPSSAEGLVFDADKCEFKRECITACPTDAIRIADGELFHCTRCGACATICPESALKVVEIEKEVNGEKVKRNRIEFNPSLCNECGDCVEVCPFSMLKIQEGEKIPLNGFCTLCDQCIEACPEGAFSLK
jgi:ferredoxin